MTETEILALLGDIRPNVAIALVIFLTIREVLLMVRKHIERSAPTGGRHSS